MKKIIYLFSLLFIYATFSYGQGTTMTIGSVTAPVGDTVAVPINVTNFNNVGAISLRISYSTSVLTFIGTANSAVTFTQSASGGKVSLGWFDITSSTPLNISSGKLTDLKFVYNGGSSNLTVVTAETEISDNLGQPISVSYVNGSVTPVPDIQMTVGAVTAEPGSSVSVPINVTGFNNVGAISLKINYDPAVLSFTGVANAPSGVTFTASASGGVLTLGWFDLTAVNPINIASGKLVDLNFNYIVGTSNLTVNTAQSEISNSLGTPLNVAYTNGSVSPSSVPSLSVGSVTTEQNSSVSVPINVLNFNNVGAISLKINYNPAVLTFSGVSNAPAGVTFTASASGGVITLGWFDLTAVNPITIASGKLVDLNFTYINGSSNLTVNTAESEISNSLGTPLSVTYTNGSVGPSSVPALTLGTVTAEPGSSVSVPINVAAFNKVGAISLKINYDPTVLTFTGVSNAPTGVTFTTSASGGVLTLGWFDITAVNPINIASGKLVDLNFNYITGTSNLTFNTTQSEISDSLGNPLTVTYSNGNVSSSSTPTLTVGTITAIPASNVSVPITVQSFNNVGAISLKINYDPAVLTFNGVSNSPSGVTFTASASGGVITLGWFDITAVNPINIASGKLVDLDFTYQSGTSNLTVNTAQSEISNALGTPLTVNYVNGSVSIDPGSVPIVSLGRLPALAGSSINVPMDVQRFNNVGAISLKIAYNAAVLTFTGVSNTPTGVTFTASASGGLLTLGWFDITALNPIDIDTGKLADLNFVYNGGQTALTFQTAQCEISNASGVPIGGIIYNNGLVELNVAPTFTRELPDTTIAEGDTLTYAYSATDPNVSTTLKYSLFTGPSGASIDSLTGSFSWIPTFTQADTYQVVVRVTDGLTPTNSRTATVIVTNTNRKPTFTKVLPDTTILEDQQLTYTYQATDPDSGTVLKYKLVVSPQGATIDSLTGVFSWKPLFTQSGSHQVKAVVTDGSLTDTSRTTIITVGNKNRPPVFTKTLPKPDTVINEGQTLTFTYQATDADGDSLTFALLPPSPSGSSIGSKTGVFTWTPTYAQAGTHKVVVSVYDGIDIVRDTATVKVINVNQSPVWVKRLSVDGTRDTIQGGKDTLKFTYQATDPDGQTLRYQLVSQLQGTATIGLFSGAFTWIPTNPTSVYTASVIVSVTDGVATISDTAKIVVMPTVDVGREDGIPKDYSMSQNYPNPFNPSTVIKFGLPKETTVSLKIYNLLGEEVATLVNEMLAAGNYRYTFDAKGLSSGIYIYRLQAGDFVSTKKMMYVR